MFSTLMRCGAVVLTMSVSAPSAQAQGCIHYNIIKDGRTERADINQFDNICTSATMKRQMCACTSQLINNNFSSAAFRQFFRIRSMGELSPIFKGDIDQIMRCAPPQEVNSYNTEHNTLINSKAWKDCLAIKN